MTEENDKGAEKLDWRLILTPLLEAIRRSKIGPDDFRLNDVGREKERIDLPILEELTGLTQEDLMEMDPRQLFLLEKTAGVLTQSAELARKEQAKRFLESLKGFTDIVCDLSVSGVSLSDQNEIIIITFNFSLKNDSSIKDVLEFLDKEDFESRATFPDRSHNKMQLARAIPIKQFCESLSGPGAIEKLASETAQQTQEVVPDLDKE